MSPAYGVARNAATLPSGDKAENTEQTLRNLGRELKQPLSTIEAIAYYLEMTIPPENLEARQYLARMQELVEEVTGSISKAVDTAAKKREA